MGTRVRTFRFNDAEEALVLGASAAAGLTPNAWVRRAVRETAAMERAVVAEDARVGLEREGWDTPVVAQRAAVASRSFTPDFRPSSKKR